MRRDRIGPLCRGSGRRTSPSCTPPFTPSVPLYAREGQAVVCPLLRGRSPTRSVAPKQPRASGVLSLRHFGLARGCRRIWQIGRASCRERVSIGGGGVGLTFMGSVSGICSSYVRVLIVCTDSCYV